MFFTVQRLLLQMEGLKVFYMNKYEVIYMLKKAYLYFTFNKNTNSSMINKWQKALNEVKDNGLYTKITRKY